MDEDDFVAGLSDTMLAAARTVADDDRFGTRSREVYLGWDPFIDNALQSPNRRLQELNEVRPQVSDVELSLERYAQQDQYLKVFGLPTPALGVGDDYIPVDLGIQQWQSTPPELAHTLLDSFSQYSRSMDIRKDLIEPERAEKGLRRGLQHFLKVRLFPSAHRDPPAHSLGATGYTFEVTTHSPGLRIHYSPAYFFNSQLAFGAPSSPVRTRIPPGRYLFGAYPPNTGFWSPAEYDVPGPTTTAHLDI